MSREELSRHEREVRANRMIVAGMAALVVLVVAVLGFGWWREFVARSSDSVAVVGSTSIPAESYARRLDLNRRFAETQLQSMQSQAAAYSSEESLASLFRQQIQQIQFSMLLLPDQTLDQMIDEQLVRQEAARQGLSVTSDEIDQEIQKNFGDQPTPVPAPEPTPAPGQPTPSPVPSPTPGPSPTPVPTVDAQAQFTNFLQVYGISGSEYRSAVEAQLLYQKLQEAMGADVPTTAEQAHARHILVDTEEKAREVLDKLKAGTSFEELAKAESTDTGTKDKGGDLGWFAKDAMVPEFDAVAFQLPLNEYSDPVKTTYGYHIIQVLERQQDRPLDPQALTSKRNGVITDWLGKAREAPDVKRLLTEGTKTWVYQKIKWRPPTP